jgi:hypothetical protein
MQRRGQTSPAQIPRLMQLILETDRCKGLMEPHRIGRVWICITSLKCFRRGESVGTGELEMRCSAPRSFGNDYVLCLIEVLWSGFYVGIRYLETCRGSTRQDMLLGSFCWECQCRACA